MKLNFILLYFIKNKKEMHNEYNKKGDHLNNYD
jgi:hypothetical protein